MRGLLRRQATHDPCLYGFRFASAVTSRSARFTRTETAQAADEGSAVEKWFISFFLASIPVQFKIGRFPNEAGGSWKASTVRLWFYESQDRLEALAGAFNDEKDHSDAQPVDAISIGDNSIINIFCSFTHLKIYILMKAS